MMKYPKLGANWSKFGELRNICIIDIPKKLTPKTDKTPQYHFFQTWVQK